MVGPGRGSVRQEAWFPIRWESPSLIRSVTSLLFERFLNPERVSMPDIDVDFCFETTAGGH